MSSLDIVVVVLAGVLLVAAIVLFFCHVKPPGGQNKSLLMGVVYFDVLHMSFAGQNNLFKVFYIFLSQTEKRRKFL